MTAGTLWIAPSDPSAQLRVPPLRLRSWRNSKAIVEHPAAARHVVESPHSQLNAISLNRPEILRRLLRLEKEKGANMQSAKFFPEVIALEENLSRVARRAEVGLQMFNASSNTGWLVVALDREGVHAHRGGAPFRKDSDQSSCFEKRLHLGLDRTRHSKTRQSQSSGSLSAVGQDSASNSHSMVRKSFTTKPKKLGLTEQRQHDPIVAVQVLGSSRQAVLCQVLR